MLWNTLVLIAFATPVFASEPITPEVVLSQEDIAEITKNQNYFHYKSLDGTKPIWMHTQRHYGKNFFDHRDHVFTYEDVLHRVLTDSFPIQEKIQELYRGRLGIHIQLGNILPQFNLDFSRGASSHGMDHAVAGVYNFLLPTNWMKLVNEKRIYDITKLMLVKATLDELLTAKTVFLQQHQRIQEFEILNYYFIHLQLLARKYPEMSRNVQTILGKFATMGTQMSSKRAEIRLGFESLALVIALAKVDTHAGTGHMNIADMVPFPEHVLDLDQLEDVYRHKHTFIKAVIENSLELRIFNQFYEISRLNIGISAFGTLETVGDSDSWHKDPQLAWKFGYGTIPTILFARSLSKTTKINVQKEYIQMLSSARESFDFNLNSIENYTEAKRALAINRAAFKKNIQYLVDTGAEPDAIFLISLDQLVLSELKLNEALHLSLVARAYMDRFILREASDVFKFLPNQGEILKNFAEIKNGKMEEIKREEEIATLFEEIKSSKDLEEVLYHSSSHPILGKLTEKELVQAVQNSMGSLLYSKIRFQKRRKFYKILDSFISKHKVQLTQMEAYLLRKKQTSWFERAFSRSYKANTPVLDSLDFGHF